MDKRRIISRNNLTIKKILIVFLALLGITLVVLENAYTNVSEIEKQMEQNLADVAKQNAAILKSKIDAQYKLLTSLSEELDGVTEDTIQEKLNHFKIFMKDFHLKRFAICLPGGMTYSTDEQETDLSYREFYQRGMEGKCCITGVMSDALNEEHNPVNVMTIPMYDEAGNVRGVFGLTYDTEQFNKSLQIDSFEGRGHSCIINEDGDIMSTTENGVFELSQNIMDDVLKTDERNHQNIQSLKYLISQKDEGGGEMYLSEKFYYYIVPVDLMDGSVTWYILTMIPSDVLSQRISNIQTNQYVTVFLVMLLVVIGALVMVIYLKEQHTRLIQFAYEDFVTKGANDRKFHLEMEKKNNRNGSLVSMDIANFNNVSIVAGEEASDMMIKDTWNIISGVLQDGELAAHIREDMFLIFLLEQEQDKVLARIEQISEGILKKSKKFGVYGIQARYGIYKMSEKEPLESVYSKVKLARESTVVNPSLNYAFYSEVNRVKMQHEKQLEDGFGQAIEKEEFEVWYQPKYSAEKCDIVGSEALVRWRKENGEMVSPGEFIPLFEQNGMIVKLDEYMFRTVCRQQQRWLEEGKVVYPVSINISRASLYRMDVHKRYQNIMQEYGIASQYIQLEITETVMEERQDIHELLNKFRDMGIKILMDDFGTGYSSLATLSLQCFDTLKLDKTLIDHIGDKDGEIMLYHIIRMGQQMGLHITAEGVERQTQLHFLQNMKCDDIQGFYFSRPLPRREYEEMINNR